MNTAQPAQTHHFGTVFGVKVYRYRALLTRYWWVVTFLVVAGLALQSWRTMNKPEMFESRSDLMLKPKMGASGVNAAGEFQYDASFLQDAMKLLRSEKIQSGARARLADFAGAGVVEIDPQLAFGTTVVSVRGTGSHSLYTQKFVGAVVAEFREFRRDMKQDVRGEEATSLRGDLSRIEGDLATAQKDLEDFYKANDMGIWTEREKQELDAASRLKTKKLELETELENLDLMSEEQLLMAGATPTAGSPGENGAGNDSGGLAGEVYRQYLGARQQLAEYEVEFAERATVWKPKHPKLIDLQSKIEKAKRFIQNLKAQRVADAQSRKESIRAQLKNLEVMIKDRDNRSVEATSKAAAYRDRQAKVDALKKSAASTKENLSSTEKTSPDDVELYVIQDATPARRVPKGWLKNLLVGVFGGLLIGGVVLYILDRSDDRISSSSEIIEHFTESILGQIPNVDESRVESDLPLLSHEEDDRYSYAEAYRSLRSSLIFLPNHESIHTLIITSAIPNEGKSTIASNLAITMAASGTRVLLVDADLRRGDIASLFDTDGRHGLSSVLRGELGWKEAIQQTKYPHLTILPRGPVTNQSGELLLKPNLEKLLAEFKADYDLVIFNTAPILATDDTPSIAPHFDGTLMVVRAQFTSARLTRNAVNALYQRQVHVLGLILNCVDTEMPDYYYYRYPKVLRRVGARREW